jgi:hypothetical protein
MRPSVDFDEMCTASHVTSQSGRRFLLAVAAGEGASVQSWDVPVAYMRAPADPRYRVTMQQPPNFDGTLAAPSKVCVMRRSMPGAPETNALWEHFRDYWFKAGVGHRFCLSTARLARSGQDARMDADNDDFLVTATRERRH